MIVSERNYYYLTSGYKRRDTLRHSCANLFLMAKTELEILEENGKKLDTFIETQTNAITAANELAAAANKKIEDEVKTINEDLAKKGKTLEEILAAQTEYKAKAGRFKANNKDEVKTTAEEIGELFEKQYKEIKAYRGGFLGQAGVEEESPWQVKTVGTMTAAANLTGSVVASYSLTPAVRGRRKVFFRDLVPLINSSTGVWKFYRQNRPPGEGSFGFQTTHGNSKAQLDYDLTEVTVTAEYLAGFARIAKQMLQDLPFLQTFVANELVEDYKRQESLEFFGNLRSNATGTWTTAATVYAEKLIDGIASLMDDDWDPSAIVTTASNWATLLKTKPNDYSVPGGIVITPDGTVTIAGVPVYVANSLYLGSGPDKTIIGDWSKAAIVQTEGLNTSFSDQDADNFTKNLITAKVEARVALAILRPDAFVVR